MRIRSDSVTTAASNKRTATHTGAIDTRESSHFIAGERF